MCFWCCRQNKEALREPLITDEDGRPSKTIHFKLLHIPEVDKVFNDFEKIFNAFVENRIALEMAENSFKQAVHSWEEATVAMRALKDYVSVFRATLSEQGITIKFRQGIATFSGAVEKVDHATTKAKDAVESMLAASEKIFNMAPNIAHASQDCLVKINNINAKSMIKDQCSSPKDVAQTIKIFSGNCTKMKQVPKMVEDFTNEVEHLIDELYDAFGEERIKAGPSSTSYDSIQGHSKEQKKAAKSKDGEVETTRKDANKKEDYEKALKMEYIDVPDIDYLFQDFATAINPFVTSREKLEKARNSLEYTMKMLSNFDPETELKQYFKVLKEKAAKDEIHLYIDVIDGDIHIRSITGVPIPKPYRDAVKCINDIRACALQLIDMEPQIERGVQSVLDDMSRINPLNDLLRVLKFKELPRLRGKLKKLNNNRKKMQKAPKIIKDFFIYIKKILSDIKDFVEEESQ